MNWDSIFTTQRIGQPKESAGPRSGFQKDFDRIIFSSAFRRLQNKTQVFPLPGSSLVHNRLTHSLEVASVGRSLGNIVGRQISDELSDRSGDSYEFYRYELANVIAAGCLAHDIGNPAFGHSGEKAISAYFVNQSDSNIDGTKLRSFFNDKEWADVSNFEGNANAVRILTHVFKGRLTAGLGLTYTTIASILKYPCESTAVNEEYKHRKKFGFYQAEAATIKVVAEKLGMDRDEEDAVVYKRHPFVYLVEAADDICYSIIDMEDAHRLGIITHELVKDSFLHVIGCLSRGQEVQNRTIEIYHKIEDANEKIAFLRARAINLLTSQVAVVFYENRDRILQGTFNDTLVGYLENNCGALKEVMKISQEQIYNHDTVLEIELAGYNVMSELLGLFIPALLKQNPDHKDRKVLKLFPAQFREFEDTTSPYKKVLNAFDLLSGMTDLYATEMYRKLIGVDIPQHR